MELTLTKKPKNPIVIEGFPGFGLVGTIATEFLLEHLQTEHIGHIWFEEMPATVAIHKNKLIDPISINYNKKHNIVIIHAVTNPVGIEWKAADAVLEICEKLGTKQLITIEGVGTAIPQPKEEALKKVIDGKGGKGVFYYANDTTLKKQLDKAKVAPLGEGIIVGVTSSILLKTKIPTAAIFAETAIGLPDSKAAARVIEVLDKMFGLGVDPKPLIKQAEQFEEKLKSLMAQVQTASKDTEKKQVGYIG